MKNTRKSQSTRRTAASSGQRAAVKVFATIRLSYSGAELGPVFRTEEAAKRWCKRKDQYIWGREYAARVLR